MATTTPNFGWTVPTSSDLVKNGATAIETLGDAIDASLLDLKGGTTNQVLAKNSNTDMDFKWVADASGIPATIIDAKGDLIAGTAADTASRLAVGANGTVLTADSSEATGMKWAASGGATGLTLVKSVTIGSAVSSVTVTDAFSATYENYRVLISGGAASADIEYLLTFGSTSSGYKWSILTSGYSSTLTTVGNTSGSTINGLRGTSSGLNNVFDVLSPNLAKNTVVSGVAIDNGQFNIMNAVVPDTTQYTAFTLTTASGTLTGGTIRVYGYNI